MTVALRTARRIKGLSQTQLADAAGVDQKTISNLENGAAPTWETACRIANVLGVNPQEIFPIPNAKEASAR